MLELRLPSSLQVALVLAVGMAWSGEATASPDAPTPESKSTASPVPAIAATGAQILNAKCVSCHTLEPVLQERDEATWKDVLNRMRLWGADLSASEMTELMKYLPKKGEGN